MNVAAQANCPRDLFPEVSATRLRRKNVVPVLAILLIAVTIEGQSSLSTISCNLPDFSHAPCILPARPPAHDDSAGLAPHRHPLALARAKLPDLLLLTMRYESLGRVRLGRGCLRASSPGVCGTPSAKG